MFIHQAFKDAFNELRPDIKTKLNLDNINDIPNEEIIQKLLAIFGVNSPYPKAHVIRLISDDGVSEYMEEILTDTKTIDDNYIRTTHKIFRRPGLIEMLNVAFPPESNEQELFKPGKIVRVCGVEKMRSLGFDGSWSTGNQSLRPYIGKHYVVLGYDIKHEYTNIIRAYTGGMIKKDVYVADPNDNIYVFPQVVLMPTTIKDLKAKYREEVLAEIIDRLKDTAKYSTTEVTEDYQSALRDFMEASKVLHERMAVNLEDEARKILELQENMLKILKQNVQIADVKYIEGQKLTVWTVPLWNNNLPIGRYRIELGFPHRHLRCFNEDINSTSTKQHPHIQADGSCCLSEWTNPMKESYQQQDYITLVGSIISYLESLNPASTYVSMADFQSRHGRKFAYMKTSAPTKSNNDITTPTEVIDLVEVTPVEADTPIFIQGDDVLYNGLGSYNIPPGITGIVRLYGPVATMVEFSNGETININNERLIKIDRNYNEYQPGDRVVIGTNDESGHQSGSIGTIENVFGDGSVIINVNNITYQHSKENIYLVRD